MMKGRKKLLPLLQSGLFRGLGAVSQLLLAWWVSHSMAKDQAGYFLFYLACFTFVSPLLLVGTQQFGMRCLSQFDKIDGMTGACARVLALYSGKALLIVTAFTIPAAITADRLLADTEGGVHVPNFMVQLLVASCFGGGCLVIAAQFHGVRQLAASLIFSHICIPTVSVILFAIFSVGDASTAISTHLFACLFSLGLGAAVWGWLFKTRGNDDVQAAIAWSWKSCFDFWLLNAFILIVNWSPLIFAGFIIAAEQIAELNVAQRSGNLMNFLLVVLSFAFAPQFRFAWSRNDIPALRRKVASCAVYLIGIGTPIFVAVIVGSQSIMGTFGSNYTSGASLLCIFATGQYFNVVTGSVNQILTMCDHERVLRNVCAISATVSAFLGVALVPSYGAIGAAIAVAIALVVQNVLAVLAVKRLLGFWVFDPRSLPSAGIDAGSPAPAS